MHPYDPTKKPHLSKIDRALRKQCKKLGIPNKTIQTDKILFIAKIKFTSQKTISVLAPYLPVQEKPIQHYEYIFIWPLSFGNLEQIYSKVEGKTHVPVPALGRWKTLSNADDIKLRQHIIARHTHSARAQHAHSANAQHARSASAQPTHSTRAQAPHSMNTQHVRAVSSEHSSAAHRKIPRKQAPKVDMSSTWTKAGRDARGKGRGEGRGAGRGGGRGGSNYHGPSKFIKLETGTNKPTQSFIGEPLAKMVKEMQKTCVLCYDIHTDHCERCVFCKTSTPDKANTGTADVTMCRGCFNDKPNVQTTPVVKLSTFLADSLKERDSTWTSTHDEKLIRRFPRLAVTCTRIDEVDRQNIRDIAIVKLGEQIVPQVNKSIIKLNADWDAKKAELKELVSTTTALITRGDAALAAQSAAAIRHANATSKAFLETANAPHGPTKLQAHNCIKDLKGDKDFNDMPLSTLILDILGPSINAIEMAFNKKEGNAADFESWLDNTLPDGDEEDVVLIGDIATTPSDNGSKNADPEEKSK